MDFLAATGRANILGDATQAIQGMAGIQALQTGKQQQALNSLQMQQMQENIAKDKRPIFVDSAFSGMGINPESNKAKAMLKFAQPYMKKDTQGRQYLEAADAREYYQTLQTPFIAEQLGTAELADRKAGVDAAEAELQKVMEGGKEDKIKEARGKVNQARMAHDDFSSKMMGLDEHLKELRKDYGIDADRYYKGEITEEQLRTMRTQSGVTPSQKLYVNPEDPKQFAYVNVNDPNAVQRAQTAGLVPKDMAGKDATSFQEKGVTERGGFTVSYDPKKAKNFVTKTDGTQEDYDPKKHGKILSTNVSQTTIYNNQQQGADAKFSPKDTSFIDKTVSGIYENKIAPSQVNIMIQRMGGGKKGGEIRREIFARLLEEHPDFSMANAELNYKAKGSSTAITSMQLAKAVEPLIDNLAEEAKNLPGQVGIVPIDAGLRAAARLTNNENIVRFDMLKNKLVEEFERMLTGTQMADSRVQRNLNLIRSGYNAAAIKAAADELRVIVSARKEAVSSPMYPSGGGGTNNRPLPKF